MLSLIGGIYVLGLVCTLFLGNYYAPDGVWASSNERWDWGTIGTLWPLALPLLVLVLGARHFETAGRARQARLRDEAEARRVAAREQTRIQVQLDKELGL